MGINFRIACSSGVGIGDFWQAVVIEEGKREERDPIGRSLKARKSEDCEGRNR